VAVGTERRSRRAKRGESGQATVLLGLALIPLIALVGLVIDIGYGYYVQRSLQASADAAALAGAQNLPDPSSSAALAREYGATPGARNHKTNVGDVTETIATKCLSSVLGCAPVNAVVVDESTEVSTIFLRVIGIDSFRVKVRSTACSPCGAKPLDVMLVLDRTGSMCMTSSGGSNPACTDLVNAQDGMRSFLSYMDPNLHHVGLAVFPPATSMSSRCSTPATSNYNSTSAPYVVVPLSRDYAANGRLNGSSALVSTINCTRAAGETAYANALEKAQAELDLHGRSDADDVIVFFSDGAANLGPTYYPASSPYRMRPCGQGVASAATIKAKGTKIYSIGYDLDALGGGANRCSSGGFFGPDEQPRITAYQALQQIASGPDAFYNQPSAGDLSAIFVAIASDVSRGNGALVDNSVQ
jgi:Flp pilus assembly protein TadG